MSKQKGFNVVEGLLIIVILSVIGFGGYSIWKNNQDDNSDNSQQESVQQNAEQPTETTQEPLTTNEEDWVKYENKQLGISFSHRSEWGEVVEKEFDDQKNSYYYEFSDASDYFGLGGNQTDYETPGRGGSLIDFGGFIREGDTLSFKNYSDGTKTPLDSSATANYKVNENGTCIYSTSVNYYDSDAYHAVCNLKKDDIYGYNFAAYVDQDPSPVSPEDFIRVIESVVIK